MTVRQAGKPGDETDQSVRLIENDNEVELDGICKHICLTEEKWYRS